jgi:hypothetical protein
MTLGRWLRAFLLFWVDFVIGDDWSVAAAIALGLVGTWGLVEAGVESWWLLPLVVVGATVISLRRTVAKARR